MRRKVAVAALLVAASCALVLALGRGSGPGAALAASHREAPLISLDAPADISDFFMFRSYEPGHEGNVVLIMDTNPGEEPSSGPNYYNFDPNVTYRFRIDNDGDGRPNDVIFEFKFRNEIRGDVTALGLPFTQVAIPPITKLDGAGSEGFGLRQHYSVAMIKGFQRVDLGSDLIAVPSNVGPRTMPNYDALAAQGIYDLGNGVRAFAGQRDDPFYIDLGGLFDTLNLGLSPLPIETNAQDANDGANAFGVDMLSGFNVQEIALEIPASMLTFDGKGADATQVPKIGAVASTYRPLFSSRGQSIGGGYQQVERLANPLVNEAIIGTPDKDAWNAIDDQGGQYGSQENKYLDYYLNPRLALALQLVYGVPAGTTGRTDLRDLLLTYNGTAPYGSYSDLLRLDLHTPPTPLASQKRLGPLAHDADGKATPDAAAWPNGRRPMDDVLDVATRVIGGANYINAHAADGVNVNDKPLPNAFPFEATPWDGRNRIHLNRPLG
ncbi:MAG: DUF4331 domain-containing protein [Actinobacteria bacterium]|nr:DUF4331 domain-containing protein [Actinomycetota bacterium]